MAGGMFGKVPVLLVLSYPRTSHNFSRSHGLVCSLVLWPIRRHSTGVSHGISGFPPCRGSMRHGAVVILFRDIVYPLLTNVTGFSPTVPSFLHLLTRRQQIRLPNGLMLSTSISTPFFRFILPSMLLNFSSSPSS